jgi:hypothetical protein
MIGTVVLLAACSVALVQGYCSSTTGDFTGVYRGTVKSDSDGYGILESVGTTEVCAWTITCPKDTFMAVTSVAADVQQDAVLSLWTSGSVLKNWTASGPGQIWEEVFPSNATEVTVTFHANGYSSYGFDMNFACHYEPTPAAIVPFPVRKVCASYTPAPSLHLRSSQSNGVFGTISYYGYQNYSNDIECTWEIECYFSETVTFSNIRYDTEVGFDFLKLQASSWYLSSTIQSYSGRGSVTSTIPVYTNRAKVRFISDPALGGRGFSMDWGCSRNFNLPPSYTDTPTPSDAPQSTSVEVSRTVATIVISVFGGFVLMTVMVIVWMQRRHTRLVKQHASSPSQEMAEGTMTEVVPQQRQHPEHSGPYRESQLPLLVATDQFPSYCGKRE